MAVRDPRTEWLRVKIYRGMTPQKRLDIVCSLNQTMRELAMGNIRHAHPDWTQAEVRRELRRRMLSPELFAKVEQSRAQRGLP